MFFYRNDISIKDGIFLLENYSDISDKLFEKIVNENRLKQVKIDVAMGNTMRVASLGKKNDFSGWMKAKQREFWKLSKTEEQKEKEALATWQKLSGTFIGDGSKKSKKKRNFFNKRKK